MRLLGVTLVGVTAETGLKVVFTLCLVLVVLLLRRLARALIRRLLGGEVADPRRFWARQGVQVVTAVVLVLGVLSI
ncbi:MAG: mechanosensitive ion channel family protein, partial [Acidimicrobiales bacterium]